MERKKYTTSIDVSPAASQSREEERESREVDTVMASASVISISQLERLVRLLDRSDVSEIELRRADEGMHLVLRKAKAPEQAASQVDMQLVVAPASAEASSGGAQEKEARHTVVAPLVGLFHPWLKPRGGTLVAVGDHVKAGQLVGTIESLNVLNEVETTVAGRVIEILVQDEQPVEYGQALIIIDSFGAAEEA